MRAGADGIARDRRQTKTREAGRRRGARGVSRVGRQEEHRGNSVGVKRETDDRQKTATGGERPKTTAMAAQGMNL